MLRNVVNFLRSLPLLYRASGDERLKNILRSYFGPFPLCIFSEPRRWFSMLASTRERFARADQRPGSFYATQLTARPFGARDQTATFLEDHVEKIRAEYDRAMDREVPSPSSVLVGEGAWSTLPLVRAAKEFSENIERCPETWRVVEQCPRPKGVRGGVYFSVLEPGTTIQPHCGPSNLKYRYHLTIHAADGARIRSGDEWREWLPDQCMVLDDSFEHEVVHAGDDRRVVLIVDCWHPDLTETERDFLRELHKRRWR